MKDLDFTILHHDITSVTDIFKSILNKHALKNLINMTLAITSADTLINLIINYPRFDKEVFDENRTLPKAGES